MIRTQDLISILKKNKISFYAGVPDSILKNLSKSFDKLCKEKNVKKFKTYYCCQ